MIVESPTKASKIQKFLGGEYKVVASYGHVRDLLNKTGAVKPEQDFDMVWQVPASAEGRLKEMAAASAGCRVLVLATDPDREGEAISWHITQELQRRGVLPRPGLLLQRVTFTEVTQKAVKEALQQPRQVSAALVDAYLGRRALDYLVGFSLSPLLWRRLSPAARSAGRVQSVALRLISEREDTRQLFRPEEYWTHLAELSLDPAAATFPPAAAAPTTDAAVRKDNNSSSSSDSFLARLVQVDGQKLSKLAVTNKQESDVLVARLWQQAHGQEQQQQQDDNACGVFYSVADVSRRPVRRNPPPPLVTSTLQQEAARRLGFSATKTMQVAQQLYEGANTGEGLITYMRTDGVNLAPAAVEELRQVIAARFGPQYLPASGPRVYKSRVKNAQEAHEAIRPTDPSLLPEHIAAQLTPDQAHLYDVIWRRAVASQMEAAESEQVTVDLLSPCGSLLLRSSGSSLSFPGFQAAWLSGGALSGQQPEALPALEQLTDADSDAEDGAAAAGGADGSSSSSSVFSQLLRQLQPGQLVKLVQVVPGQHFTEPPPRFTEASMVKSLEELGVGRPSTYAPILRLLQTRGYVSRSGRALVPTPLGRVLTAYLTVNFPEYVDVNFTARVEEQLDEVSAGSLPWKQLMVDFWAPLEAAVAAAGKASTTKVFEELERKLEHLIFQQQPAAAGDSAVDGQAAAGETAAAAGARACLDPRICPACGGRLVLKPSRTTGAFIGCSNHSSTGCTFGRPLWPDAEELLLLSDEEEEVAAAAAAAANGDRHFSSSMGIIGNSKLLGQQPGTGAPVWIKRGPFGLYLQLGDDPVNPAAAAAAAAVQPDDSSSSSSKVVRAAKGSGPVRAALPRGIGWAQLTLDSALQLLALPRVVGTHPESGEPIQAATGRFGPYICHKSLYVTLPKGLGPAEVSLEAALQLIEAKEKRLLARGEDPYSVKVKPDRKTKAKPGKKAGRAAASSSSSSTGRLSGYNLYVREKMAAATSSSNSSNGDGGTPTSSDAASNTPGTRFQLLAAAWKALPDQDKSAYSSRAKEISAAAADASGDAAAGAAKQRKASSTPSTGSRRRTGTALADSSSSSSSSPSRRRGISSAAVSKSELLDSSSSSGSRRRFASSAAASRPEASDGSSSSSSGSRRRIARSAAASRPEASDYSSSSSSSSSGSRWRGASPGGAAAAGNGTANGGNGSSNSGANVNGSSRGAGLLAFNLFVREMSGRQPQAPMPEPELVGAAAAAVSAGRSRSRAKAPSRMQLLAAAWKALPERDRLLYRERAREIHNAQLN